MFNAHVSRLIASVTTLACSVHVFFLRLHNVSFGCISHFTIFKPNTAMQQSAPPPHQGVDGLASAISDLRRSPHPIPPWRASSSNRRAIDWPEQKLRLPSPANLQKPN